MIYIYIYDIYHYYIIIQLKKHACRHRCIPLHMYMSWRLEELVELLEFVTGETGDVFRWGSQAWGGHKPDDIIIWPWVKTYGAIFGWMNIHLPSILLFTRVPRFWPMAISKLGKIYNSFNQSSWGFNQSRGVRSSFSLPTFQSISSDLTCQNTKTIMNIHIYSQ